MGIRFEGGRGILGLLYCTALWSGCARLTEKSDGQTVRRSDSRTVIDTILPIDEEIRRFREQVPDVPTRLAGGARSRDALVGKWVRSIETRDSVALGDMLMSAAEYITFFYPESQYTRRPYRQSPRVRWGLITNSSLQGASRVWTRHAGQSLGFRGYRCDPEPTTLGRNLIWTGCVVDRKDSAPLELFGPIIERDGHFKFVTYGSGY